MGDDLLKAQITFYPREVPDLAQAFKRISQISMEHRYKRLGIEMNSIYQHGFYGINIDYRLPGLDADRDGRHRCDLMVFFERVIWIMRSIFGPEEKNWSLSASGRMP